MKKLLCLCLAALMLFTLASCGEGAAPVQKGTTPAISRDAAPAEPAPAEPTAPAENTGEGDLAEYHVRVTGYQLIKDYEGKDAIVLDYEFTNNGEEATSALYALYFKLFQNGIQLEHAFVVDDNYDSENDSKDIKTGVTLACQCAYVLENTISPVEVEITKAFSFSNASVSYVIDLAE